MLPTRRADATGASGCGVFFWWQCCFFSSCCGVWNLSGGAGGGLDFSRKTCRRALKYLFGTDWMGRDMLSRTLAGLSTSIRIGAGVGGQRSYCAFLGTAAAVGGKWADGIISWCIDLMMGVPHIVLLLLISYALGKGEKGVIVGVALTHWPNLARVIRGEILQVREAAYVGITKQLGKSPWYIARWHIFPQILPQFLVGLVLLFPHAILHEASITFLGFGLPPEKPAIGVILSEKHVVSEHRKMVAGALPGTGAGRRGDSFDRIGSGLKALLDPSSAQAVEVRQSWKREPNVPGRAAEVEKNDGREKELLRIEHLTVSFAQYEKRSAKAEGTSGDP